jgi:hypothetical protein
METVDQFCSLYKSPPSTHPLVPVPSFDMHQVRTLQLCFFKNSFDNMLRLMSGNYRLCGLVVRVPGSRSRGSGSIPGAARFSEK